MKKILLWVGVITVTALMLFFPTESVTYAKNAMDLCSDTVIPSLFPFFVCSGLLVHSGFCSTLAGVAKPVMKPLFNVNENGAGAFILGIISGYPLGAVTACQLYESGYLSKYEAERLLSFCNNSGPLFILGAVGVCMYADAKIGLLLYISHLLSALTVGVIFRFYKRNKHTAPNSTITTSEKGFSQIYSTVMQSSLNSIITICGSVVFFGMATSLILAHIPIEPVTRSLLLGILEMTGGVNAVSRLHLDLTQKLMLSAFMVGFAGFCVHLQVISTVSRYNLSLFPYFFGKFLHGILSVIYIYLFMKLLPVSCAVFSQPVTSYSQGFFVSSMFVCLSVIFFLVLLLVIYFLPRKKAVI